MPNFEVIVEKVETHSISIEIEDVADEDEAHDLAMDKAKKLTNWELDDTEYEVSDINELV